MQYTESGGTYNVFNIGLPGVGVVFAYRSHTSTLGWSSYKPWNSPYNVDGYGTTGGSGDYQVGGQVKMRLIQTGKISAGTTTAFTPVRAEASPDWGTVASTKYFTVNPVTFNALSCSAEGMNVTLPSVQKSEFSSNITPKVTPFQFTLRNCPAGMESITYQVTPMSPIITSADGTFANSTGTGMALGVGLRITDSTNTAAVDFASIYPVADYSPTSGNSALPIPMHVSYFRTDTADAVSPGRVQGALQLTVFYN
jgi:major type 1 subunit fimbrin (pilin)